MLSIFDSHPPTAVTAERRYLTIMFIDLVGYTALSEELDPEELQVVQRRYQLLANGIMERFGGFVAQFTGDGIMIYFGYPLTSKYDVRRAFLAALEFSAGLPTIDMRLAGRTLAPLSARVGVHTGLVMLAPEISRGGVTELRATGEAVNLAARLQHEAPPGGIATSKSTLDLAGGGFDVRELANRRLRGLSRATTIYHVVGTRSDEPERLPPPATGHLFGRADALGNLLAEWQRAHGDSPPRIVIVEGEAGVGKTRVAQEFLAREEIDHAFVVKIMCDEIFANTALYPLTTYLRRRAGFEAGDTPAQQQRRIGLLLGDSDLHTPANENVLASLLGIAEPVLDQQVSTLALHKRRQLALIVELFHRTVTARPSILWIDDSHWLDPSSAELLGRLVRAIPRGRLMIVLTRRLYPSGPLLPAADSVIALGQLDADTARRIARSISGADLLPEAVVTRALEAAEGLPLFIEQFIISLVENHAVASPARIADGVPLRLATMMSERLDRRPGARRIAQVAACIGRSFVPEFLAHLLDGDVMAVIGQLRDLVDAELLVQRRVGTEQRFEFRHALIQRVAYESMLITERLVTHGRIADRIAAAASSRPEHLELLAYHLTRAARITEAIAAWLKVGQAGARVSAHLEAIDSLRKGLALLSQVDDKEQRDGLEVGLRLAMIGPLIAAHGAAAASVSESCERGLEICRDRDLGAVALPFAFGQFTFANCSGATGDAARLAELFVATAVRANNLSAEVVGERMTGTVLFGQGRVAEARTHMERSLALYNHERDAATTDIFGQNTEVHTRSALALALFAQGEVDGALEMGDSVLRIADRLRHPHSTVMPLTYVGGWIFGLCGATAALAQHATELCALTERHGMRVFAAYGAGLLGWAKTENGDLGAGERLLAQCISELDATGIVLALSGHLMCHAECLRRLGCLGSARREIDRAIALLEPSSFCWLEPEVRRIEALITFDESSSHAAVAIAKLHAAAEAAGVSGFSVLEWRCLQSAVACGSDGSRTTLPLAALAHLATLPARIDAMLAV